MSEVLTVEELKEIETRIDNETHPFQTFAAAIIIDDAKSYEQGADFLVRVKTYCKKIHADLDPAIASANETHKLLTGKRGAKLKPLTAVGTLVSRKMLDWTRVTEAKRLADERGARRIEREKADDAKLELAATLESSGMDEAAAYVLDEPTRPAPIVRPTLVPTSKDTGVTITDKWEWRVVNRNLVPPEYMEVDKIAVNLAVRGLKGRTNIPGIEVYNVGGTRVRS